MSNRPKASVPPRDGSSYFLIPTDPGSCPDRTIYNGEKYVTAPHKQPVYDPPLEFRDGYCVLEETPAYEPECPPGFRVKGKNYISTENPECPLGLERIDEDCVYPAPPSYPPDISEYVANDNPEYPPGFRFVDNQYVSKNKPKCPPGSSLVGEECIVKRAPDCPPSTQF
ncbi:hypothetical protein PENARI_c079G06016 [Penicillium arizonense]|uniref:Oocyst wall protein n=1 Tax=Penicillium arizonense TaxID=1835702 RepID=A0A1F5L1B4_PENAI|nr:hypothetical protein PENARI_c079G06016 [Penicillium arizonense]OGE46992.1 hypothetical protein PENARI_c079G06016 [Penicillium arizonense]